MDGSPALGRNALAVYGPTGRCVHQGITVSGVDPDELMAVLDGGDFDPLLGTIEHQRIEFKEQPYNLDGRRGVYELAKDVSGFAQRGRWRHRHRRPNADERGNAG